MAQEHGRAICFEEDHGVVRQAAKDAVQLQAAADVAGDSAERFRAVEVLCDFLRLAADADHPADRLGRQRRELGVAIRE
jgi:hypothetical protein